MNKLLTIVTLIGLLRLTSCKEEDAPVATVSFSTSASLVGEGDEKAIIALSLDRAPSNDLVLNFTMIGSAKLNDDYVSSGSVTIAAGATEAAIEIEIIDDNVFEFDEEIVEVFGEGILITLSGITGNGVLSEEVAAINHFLVIEENDPLPIGMRVDLTWDSGDGTAGDVDMDLILAYEDPSGDQFVVASSLQIGTEFEAIVIPTIAPDGKYGMSLRYFEGTSDNLEFTVKFTVAEAFSLPGNVSSLSYVGVYTLANINGDETAAVKVEQTFDKQGSNIINISDIEVPTLGSRRRIMGVTPPARY